jgi:L-histidine Nalpha-methyltransferase
VNTIQQLSQPKGRLQILNCLLADDHEATSREIIEGLLQPQKRLPSKYFYDAHGSRLFEQICDLPEYYLTRTELAVLRKYASDIMAFFAGEFGDLVELGSGSKRKIDILLSAMVGPGLRRVRYVPLDISASALYEASLELSYSYEDLDILGIIADFTQHLEVLPQGRKLITFLGSTIGNFTDAERLTFLQGVAQAMNPEDRFLLGLDMLKSSDFITAAYNDRQGVTAAFNKNILANLNRSFHADFNIADFEHQAVFINDKEQVEMYLRATRESVARITDLNLSVSCYKGENIRTEICKKFSRATANGDFQRAGLVATKWFQDPQGWFSLVLLRRA